MRSDRAIVGYRKALTLRLDETSRRQIGKVLKQLGAAAEQGVTSADGSKWLSVK
jgi:hypothetical protein